MKVIATDASVKLNKGLKEFHRLVEEGEIFEVDEERFKFLNGDNPYNAVFVEEYNKGKITFWLKDTRQILRLSFLEQTHRLVR